MRLIQKMRQTAGFTLIEIIATVMILSLLATLAMPAIQQCYHRLQLDTAIVQLHKDIRWAQKMANKEQGRFTIMFFQDKQPYRYVIQRVSDRVYVKRVELPNGLSAFKASTIIIYPDKTFKNNGHVLIQKGEVSRYVYYYQTGRSRVTSISG